MSKTRYSRVECICYFFMYFELEEIDMYLEGLGNKPL